MTFHYYICTLLHNLLKCRNLTMALVGEIFRVYRDEGEAAYTPPSECLLKCRNLTKVVFHVVLVAIDNIVARWSITEKSLARRKTAGGH